ncbi:MAG: hypothetical protein DMG30_08045 [Acidobacteria bacterium]|nr:MAG: hypothetical protein DMG30_08045 [Acidobacteriota bacterium]
MKIELWKLLGVPWSVRSVARTRKLKQGLNTLATIGSTAPFVGLFGTVIGIINSFRG